MGLEESPHCPFDVMEACRTGVRRDSHQPGGDIPIKSTEKRLSGCHFPGRQIVYYIGVSQNADFNTAIGAPPDFRFCVRFSGTHT